jgi:hypothetical protein
MSTPLRDLLHELLFEPPARAAFAADPEGFLGDHGWDGLGGHDVEAALSALVDELPPDQAARLAALEAEENGFDDGLAGAIAGLEAATSAIDGELETDPVASGLDPDAADDSTFLDDLDGSGAPIEEDPSDALDDVGFGDAAEPPTGATETTTLDEREGAIDDEPDAGEADGQPDLATLDDPEGIDGLWSYEPEEPSIDQDAPEDDIID